jgi:hypothetical protein
VTEKRNNYKDLDVLLEESEEKHNILRDLAPPIIMDDDEVILIKSPGKLVLQNSVS